jgi:hypothetical protein
MPFDDVLWDGEVLRQASDREFERYVTHAQTKLRAPMREERAGNRAGTPVPRAAPPVAIAPARADDLLRRHLHRRRDRHHRLRPEGGRESPLSAEFPVSRLGNPSGITAGPDGALWFLAAEDGYTHLPGAIGRITTAGVATTIPTPALTGIYGDITVGPNGALWFPAVVNGMGGVARLTVGGVVTEFNPGGFDVVVNGLTLGPDGALWYTDGGIGRFAVSDNTHDFNGDGKSAIAWRDTSGNAAVWLMNGASLLQSAGLGSAPIAWSVVGQRDFNGDGKQDWLWHDTSGNVAMWFLNGAQVTQSVGVGSVATAWSIVGTGDFNGDGKGDILWADRSGNIAVWLMNGAQLSQSAGLGSAPTTWSIVETGDFNGDGKSDVLWQTLAAMSPSGS